MCGIDYNRFPEWEKTNWYGRDKCHFCGKFVNGDDSIYDDELDDFVCLECAKEM